MSSSGRCRILEDLPPELRLRIYEHLFCEPCHSSVLIRSDSKIEIISLAKAHAAILKTCRTIYREATPILYSTTTFRVQIYPAEGWPSCGNVGQLRKSSLFLGRVQHLDIKSCIFLPIHVEPALRLMKAFAIALEEAHASIKTLNVRSKLFPDVSEKRRNMYEEQLCESDFCAEARPTGTFLFQRMMEAANARVPRSNSEMT